MKYPIILRLLLPLMMGVIVHFYTEFAIGLPLLVVFLLTILVLTTPMFSKLRAGSILFHSIYPLLFFFLGGYLADAHKSSVNDHYFLEQTNGWANYLVKVTESPQEKEKSIKCIVEVQSVDGTPACGKGLVYFQKDAQVSPPEYGDLIYLNARFNKVKSNGNPKEFDYARYLRIHNIEAQAYVKNESWKKVGNEANPFLEWVFDLRTYFSNVLKSSGMSEKNAMVANALLLGQKEYLDKDVLRSYSSAGAMHVLAVSGLHVGIVMLILSFLVKPIKQFKYGRKLFVLIVVCGIWFYALITGFSPSVMRAAVMFTFIVVGKELQRDTSIYQSIMVSAFLLIILEPYIIFQVGFQLSYLAVLGIVFLQPKIENLLYIKNKILFKAWQISAVSIAAQIATFPLGLYYFHQFPNFFLLSNLLVIPLAFFILIVGIAYLTLHIVPFISDVIFWIFDGLISILNLGVEWVEKLPYSILWGISIEWYEVFLLYITILLGAIAFMYRKTKVLIAALVGCVVMLVINAGEQQKLQSENVLYIYNIQDELAIDVFYGQKNIFFSSEELQKDEEKLLFHVKHNWFYRNGNEEPTKWQNIFDKPFIQVGKHTFGLLSDAKLNDYRRSIPITDYLILHDIEFVDEFVLQAIEDQNITLILAGGVGYKLKNFVKSIVKDSRIIDLNEKGAFELYF
ncbi:MAG: ComEC family competence protein [Crocinitomicaceae bacterium]|nr:ComEC family competence protein [Crocinitomicaceae bacterium]